MINREELQQQVARVYDGFIVTLASFSEQDINKVPFEGSWTPAQIADHMINANSGIPRLLQGPTEPTGRGMDEKIQAIKDVFLDFNARYKAPEFTEPSSAPQVQNILLLALEKTKSELIQAAETLDLTPLCLAFEVPGFGPFTRFEWINFGLIHMTRHTRQLRNILEHVQAGNAQ